MNENIYDAEGAAEFLGITGSDPVQSILKMVRKKMIRATLISRKHGYRFHRKSLEDFARMGGFKK